MENSNLIEKFLFPLLVSPIFIGVIMLIKANVSSMWIRCLYSTKFSHCNNENRKIYDIEKITLYLKEEHGTFSYVFNLWCH